MEKMWTVRIVQLDPDTRTAYREFTHQVTDSRLDSEIAATWRAYNMDNTELYVNPVQTHV